MGFLLRKYGIKIPVNWHEFQKLDSSWLTGNPPVKLVQPQLTNAEFDVEIPLQYRFLDGKHVFL